MKKISVAVMLFIAVYTSHACDICGCGVGSNYIGILPEFQKHIVGLRYRTNSLQTHLDVNGNRTYLSANETYQLAELWGGWNIGNRFRLMPVAPYAVNERCKQGTTTAKSGIGDVSLSGFYQVINTRKNVLEDKLLVQSLWMGAGIKLPTGKYTEADKQNTAQNANLFQLGTGSADFIFNAMYDIRLQDAGFNLTANYKVNTSNKYDYRYGNKMSFSSQLYYKFRIKNRLTLSPNAGINLEAAQKDRDKNFAVDISGGRIVLAGLGIEAGWKKIAMGANFQAPFRQDLANGAVRAGNRWMGHIAFSW